MSEVNDHLDLQPHELMGCPVCCGALEVIKCKIICTQCHAIVENCNGD